MVKLGKLKRIEDLRLAWAHEALDFTHWLAKEENLSLLSNEIDIRMILKKTEASVGKFSVDILAEEEHSDKKIIIENQLEGTNHDHLGKIITYASGYDAEIIIWIVKSVRDEHKQAVDWLNEHTDEKLNFFVIKMELWQIGDSPMAPKFQVICQPNDWAKSIKKSVQYGELTETTTIQLEFWNGFKEYAASKGSKLRLRKASPRHWYDLSIGSSLAHISLTTNSQQSGGLGCELYIPDDKSLYHFLESKKEKIEKELNLNLEWMELERAKASRIKFSTDKNIKNTNDWNEYFTTLLLVAEKFHDVFGKYIKNAKNNA